MKKNSINNRTIYQKRIIKKIILDIILLIMLVISGYYTFIKSTSFSSEEKVKYNEKSNIDYKVYLKQNSYYEKNYLGKNMLYVASLIDNIAFDFDYNFESEKVENIDFLYSITAKLTINSQSGTKPYYEKTYVLLNNKSVKMSDLKTKNIHEQIKIDYPYYNQLASNFKVQYGLDADSKLTLYMTISKKSNTENSFESNNKSTMEVNIPLSQRAIDIKLDYKEINTTNKLIERKTVTITNKYYFIIVGAISIFAAVIITFIIYNIICLFKRKRTEFDKFVSKTLKVYDRLIVESSTLMSIEAKEIVRIQKFTELLDIHDNLQLPIMYFEKEKHHLGYFYISQNNTVYLMTVSSDDLKKDQK